MKKTNVLLVSLALTALVFSSCKKEEMLFNGPKMTAEIEEMAVVDDEESSKTIYNPGTGQFLWKANDKIRVFDDQYRSIVYKDEAAYAAYDYTTHQYTGSTSLIRLVPSTDPADYYGYNNIDQNSSMYYAFYPSYYVDLKSDHTFEYTIPAKLLIDNNQNVDKIEQSHLSRFPMAYKTSSNSLQMKNLCGGIRLSLHKAGAYVKSIQFRPKGNQQVTGTFSVTFNSDGIPTLSPIAANINSTTKVTTLELNQPVSINSPRNFFIALPPQVYSQGWDIIVTDANNKTATISSTKSMTINRSKIRFIKVTEDKLNSLGGFQESHGRFSINSNGDQVYIAPGNLQWNNGNWQFANEQFDVMNFGCGAAYNPDAYNWDLFHYSLESQNTTYEMGQYSLVYPLNITNREVAGNNNFGMSTTEADYISTFNQGTGHGSSKVYRDWGKAFGDNSTWKVLTSTEFMYIVTGRSNAQLLCTVGGVEHASYCRLNVIDDFGQEHPGLLIFPDNWENGFTNASIATAITWKTGWHINNLNVGNNDWAQTANFITMDDYRVLEAAGCAFLPATGWVASGYTPSASSTINGVCINRGDNNQGTYNVRCCYWTSTFQSIWYDNKAIDQNGTVWTMEQTDFSNQTVSKGYFCAVRLFMPCNN